MSGCRDRQLMYSLVQRAPDRVIKAICNAAINAQQGDVNLSQRDKRVFRKNRKAFAVLINRRIPISSKRNRLQKGHGFFAVGLLPALLSAVLSSIGSRFIGNNQ